MRTMPPHERVLYVDKYVEEMSMTEIAEKYEISYSSIVLVFRVMRKKLKVSYDLYEKKDDYCFELLRSCSMKNAFGVASKILQHRKP